MCGILLRKACRAVYARASDPSTIQKNSVENTTRIRNGMSLFGGHPVLLWLTPYAFVPSRVCCVLVFVVFVLLLFAEDHNNDLYQRDYNMEDCPLVDEDHRQGHVFGEDEDDDGNQSRDVGVGSSVGAGVGVGSSDGIGVGVGFASQTAFSTTSLAGIVNASFSIVTSSLLQPENL